MSYPSYSRNKEDVLPKMVFCGITEKNIPKLLVCEDQNKYDDISCSGPCYQPPRPQPQPNPYQNCQPQQNYQQPYQNYPNMQPMFPHQPPMQCPPPRMPCPPPRMPCTPPPMPRAPPQMPCTPPPCPPKPLTPCEEIQKLQSDICAKDQIIEGLQQTICCLECEMDILKEENKKICEKIERLMPGNRNSCSKSAVPIESRMTGFCETTKLLEQQVKDMENHVKVMKNELSTVLAQKSKAEQNNKIIMMCPPPCFGPPFPPCPVIPKECS